MIYQFSNQNSMWQNIAVAIIGVAIISKLIYNIYKFFVLKSENNQPFCTGCSGCKPNKEKKSVVKIWK
ncbi:MAG: hypothetical protein H6Q14_2018 [Bacteroidetes bacterium]|jgi:hypothetical protein|nr:hypothetical protein [Bacteroidota bacterium]